MCETSEFYLLFVNTLFIHLYLKCTHISPLGYGLHEFSLGFNTVANVYPNQIFGNLSEYLNEYVANFVRQSSASSATTFDMSKFEPKDLLLKKFKSKYNLKEYILEPSVFQHVGLQSSFSFANTFHSDAARDKKLYQLQFRPFQSYSFMKEYTKPLVFDPLYFYLFSQTE